MIVLPFRFPNVRGFIALLLMGVLVSRAALASNDRHNFLCPDEAVRKAAESARRRSALFWSGSELPGPWFRPCPIVVRYQNQQGSGTTRFLFDRGEVSGWQMQVEGSPQAILNDVIPHEVDHMVRASLVRRPIVRWLDEGCAILMESCESHAFFRGRLHEHLEQPLAVSFLDAVDYPASSSACDAVYVIGFSLTEYLLTLDSPRRLLDFQRDPRRPSHKLEEYYGISPRRFLTNWRNWARERGRFGPACHAVGCLFGTKPAAKGAAENNLRPELKIFSSEWCGPCRRFWDDYRKDGEFRDAIRRHFLVQSIDVDLQSAFARTYGIDRVPTFLTAKLKLTGYAGKEWLLARLGITASQTESVPDAESPSLPEKETSFPDREKPGDRPSQAVHPEQPVHVSGEQRLSGQTDLAANWGPMIVTVLQLLGVSSGVLATGGAGGIAMGIVLALWRRRRARRKQKRRSMASPSSSSSDHETPNDDLGGPAWPVPFPRKLDEARELLALRQSEGRVAILDALRGMFLDDELEKISRQGDARLQEFVTQLRERINARVEEVAPLSTEPA